MKAPNPNHDVWRKEFEEHGEEYVRTLSFTGNIHWQERERFARAWLAEQDNLRSALHQAETISVAKEANRISEESATAAKLSAESAAKQARWAMWAAIIAVVSAIIAVTSSK